MLIKYLKEDYPLVYEAALRNQEIQGNARNDNIDIDWSKETSNFNWSETIEKSAFWSYIADQNFEGAKKLQPHLFEDKPDNSLEEIKSKLKVGTVLKRIDYLNYAECNVSIGTTDTVTDLEEVNSDWIRLEKFGLIRTNYLFGEFEIVPEESNSELPKFEVGKWYKISYSPHSYRKFLKLIDQKFYYSERIEGDYQKNEDWAYISNIDKNSLEDLSEIQKYLPDGHPDKKSKITTGKDWSKATDEELLEEAKRRYPIGSKVRCLSPTASSEIPEIIKNELVWYDKGNSIIQSGSPYTRVYYKDENIWAEIVELPKEAKKYDYEVVHCKTQEEWDFVFKMNPGKLNYGKNIYEKDYKNGDGCISLKELCHSPLNFYLEENAKIYSFEEWCAMNNYKPDFNIKNQEIDYTFIKDICRYGHPVPINESNLSKGLYNQISDSTLTREDFGKTFNPTIKEKVNINQFPEVNLTNFNIKRKKKKTISLI
jgi:hypothetical protein